MVLASFEPVQWVLAAAALVSGLASLGGFVLNRRKDHGEATRTFVTNALAAQDAALKTATDRAESAEKRAEKAERGVATVRAEVRIEMRELTGAVRELTRAVQECEQEKGALAERVHELEAAR